MKLSIGLTIIVIVIWITVWVVLIIKFFNIKKIEEKMKKKLEEQKNNMEL